MNFKVFTTLLTPQKVALVLTLLGCQLASGATVNQEKERLAELQQDLVRQEQQIPSIEAEIKSLPEKITEAQNAVSTAEAELSAEQKVFDELKNSHDTSPSDISERKLKLAEIKLGVASTKVRSETRSLERLQGKQKELQDSLANAKSAVESVRSKIQGQEKQLQKTIELARQQELEAAKPKPILPPKPAPKIVVAQPVIAAPKQEVAQPTPSVAKTQMRSEEKSDKNEIISLPEPDFKKFEFAKEQMAMIKQIAAEGSSSQQASEELFLSGKDIENVIFTHLGNDQYRADAFLPSGRQSYRIKGLKFQLEISELDSTQEYVFLVDAREKNDLNARYFKKKWLSFFDKKVVQAPETIPEENKEEEYNASKVAKQRLAAAEAIAAEAEGKDQPNHDDMQLSGSDIKTADFSYMGNQQYRVDVVLPSGRQDFRVKGLRFQLDIPKSAKAEEYVFIVDARDKNDLEASYFKKDLLSYDEKDVAATP